MIYFRPESGSKSKVFSEECIRRGHRARVCRKNGVGYLSVECNRCRHGKYIWEGEVM